MNVNRPSRARWGVKDDNHLNDEDDNGVLKPRTRFGGRFKFSSYLSPSLYWWLVEELCKRVVEDTANNEAACA